MVYLSETQKASYSDDGFLVVENLLSCDEVEGFLAAQDGTVEMEVDEERVF